MNETIDFEQVGMLLGLAAARDQRTVGDADTLAWHQDLNAAAVGYRDAEAAITHFYAVVMAGLEPKDRRRITTPDIISIARQLRRERLANLRYDGDPDETPQQYLARLRTQIAAVADGLAGPDAGQRALGPGTPTRRTTRALAAVGRDIPADAASASKVRRPGPGGIACPKCHAPIGRPCRLPSGAERPKAHPARVTAATTERTPS
ncbi:hypothetical protein [Streptomyces sp. SBT349]|uniref:zinc finger domain-containing protein n=1 Tax=Streptomyces sp. SBT349 TaxID=1580539 RepID=UPI00066A1A08|nr:hypothetical protein [Streptomyces sp. SBT349]